MKPIVARLASGWATLRMRLRLSGTMVEGALRADERREASQASPKATVSAGKIASFRKAWPIVLQEPYPANRLLLGKPLGGRRPASARLPIQSLRSALATVKVRPAESVQVRPSARLKTFASDMPPSL